MRVNQDYNVRIISLFLFDAIAIILINRKFERSVRDDDSSLDRLMLNGG